MEDKYKKVADRIETYEDEIIALQSDLVSCPALGPVNGGQGEWEKAGLLEAWLGKMNPDLILRIDAPDDRVESGFRPNTIAIFNGKGNSKAWVLSHMDIVPPGESSLWDSDPYVLRRDGDRIYGRGVEDNHHGLVASYFAVKALRDEKIIPEHNVGLIFVSDEETGSEYGLDHVLKKRADLFSPNDLIIVPDSGNADSTELEIAEKSMLWLKFTVKGKQGHASRPADAANTLRASARIITAVDEALHSKYDGKDDLFEPAESTFEPTKKEANVPNTNTIPGEDVFHFDCRVLPQYDLDEVLTLVKKTANDAVAGSGVTVSVEAVFKMQAPPPTPVDSSIVQALTRAVFEVHGRKTKTIGIGGGTVAAFFRQQGLPAAVWSTVEETAHQPNEYTSLTNIKDDAKVMARVFMGL